jgi:hypothetical protein
MIETPSHLLQTIEQMERMARILQSEYTSVRPQSQAWYDLMAEGPLDYIRIMSDEVTEYVCRQMAEIEARAPQEGLEEDAA